MYLTRRFTVGLRGFKLNPALLTYFMNKPPPRPARHGGHRQERQIRKRLDDEQIERLVAEYVDGAAAAELGRRYGIAKNSVLALVRLSGERVRHRRFSAAETDQLVALFEAGMPQSEIAERLGRSPSAVWHYLRRLGTVGTHE
jgi:DNA-binding CsgD family transcriptional regulator